MSRHHFPSAIVVTLAAFAFLPACMGGATSPTNSAPQGWVFNADGGPLVSGSPPPTGVVFNGTLTYLYLGDGSRLVAADAHTFTPNSNTSLYGPGISAVQLANGSYRAYSGSGSLMSFMSADGTNWAQEAGDRFTYPGQAGGNGSVAANGGLVRVFYADGDNAIASAMSADGLNFSAESGLRLAKLSDNNHARWARPFVAISSAGQWVMVVMKAPEDENTHRSELWLATSTDGASWTVDTTALIPGTSGSVAFPVLVRMGSTLRVYYCIAPGANANSVSTYDSRCDLKTGTLTK